MTRCVCLSSLLMGMMLDVNTLVYEISTFLTLDFAIESGVGCGVG